MTTQTDPNAQGLPQPAPQEPAQQTQPGQNEPATQASEPDEDLAKLANEQLRSYADKVASENKSLKPLAMRSALAEIGLEVDQGLGLAIVESYQGEITDEAIANFAAEKYKHGAAQQPQAQQDPAVAAAQRAEQLQQQGQSVPPQPAQSRGQESATKVDTNDPEVTRQETLLSVNEKANEFMRQHYPGNVQQ